MQVGKVHNEKAVGKEGYNATVHKSKSKYILLASQ